jgi:dTDP-4-dehydrorhamnose 3,5-epimerase
MIVTPLYIPEVLLIDPKINNDERGFFFESFNQKLFENRTGLKPTFVQDNHSKSRKRVLRGMHYQLPPKAQDKLIRVVQGEVYDVAIDLRRTSHTFGKWVGEVLSEENKKQLWIPIGFAHGFLCLSETAEIVYKTTEYFSPIYERCITWNDSNVGIIWPHIDRIVVSDKDQLVKYFNNSARF